MADRKETLKALACKANDPVVDCTGCPYQDRDSCDYQQICKDALAVLKENKPITGDTSDGYHTFNELYHHRAVLFSVIVRDHEDLAWKARKHHDGTMFDGMFIVGIETPEGQATYHYDLDPYWDMFECKELECAPEWDGHTPAEAIERIGRLKAQEHSPRHGHFIGTEFDGYADGNPVYYEWQCSECGCVFEDDEPNNKFCPNCGAKMDGEEDNAK